MTFLLLYWKQAVGAALLLFVLGFAYHLGGANGRAKLAECHAKAEKTIADMARAEADLQAKYRKAEQDTAAEIASAQDEADKRNEKIESDYRRRIAGVVSERDRLQDLWRSHLATDRVSDSAAAARAADEQDRLRRESAARIVWAAEQAQSERDEAIDRYQAVRQGRK